MTKNYNKFPEFESDYVSPEKERMPSEAMEEMAKLFQNSDSDQFRKDVLKTIVWLDPSFAKHFIRSQVPYNAMFDPRQLDEIKPEMSLKEKRKRLVNSVVDVSNLRCATLNKVTVMKKRLVLKGYKISSNKITGLQDLHNSSLSSLAKNISDILMWNCGQLNIWHALNNKFNKECTDKKLVNELGAYSKVAFHKIRLPALTKAMKEIAQQE